MPSALRCGRSPRYTSSRRTSPSKGAMARSPLRRRLSTRVAAFTSIAQCCPAREQESTSVSRASLGIGKPLDLVDHDPRAWRQRAQRTGERARIRQEGLRERLVEEIESVGVGKQAVSTLDMCPLAITLRRKVTT